MKKIFFLLAFAFVGQQAFSQMYIVQMSSVSSSHIRNCPWQSTNDVVMTTIDPAGNITYHCMEYDLNNGGNSNSGAIRISELNQNFNNIINLGYKLVAYDGQNNIAVSNPIGTWYFAIPWTPSGLEEVPQTLKNLNIHPNPANEFIDIVLDYDIKSSSEIVIYSEAGYIYHKEKVSKLNRNEPYRLDISKVPAGKYFITIVNDKSYTTAQKLIII